MFRRCPPGYWESMDPTHSPLTARLTKIYLQDHYAGATAGVDLARRAASSHSNPPRRAELGAIAREIAQDRAALHAIMGSLRVRPSRTKVLLAWVGEKVGRLKANGRLTKRSALSDVVELEGLIMGVSGKASLWESLLQAVGHDRRLHEPGLQRLAKRAEDQKARLEQLHREHARSTFG